MNRATETGTIVVLNGAPRSGKTSIAAAIQERFDGVWLALGVDLFAGTIPPRFRPGMGLRPGGERPDLEPLVTTLYSALYETVAAQSRLGLNVVVDVGHHEDYSMPLGTLFDAARRLEGLPAFLVGVRCSLETILERRRATGYLAEAEDGSIPDPILRWQTEVHRPGIYDLDVDTSIQSAEACADAIHERLVQGSAFPTVFERRVNLKFGGGGGS